MNKKPASNGAEQNASENSENYSEAKGMLARFEKLIKEGEAKRILEKSSELDEYFEKLKQNNPATYLATESRRKRIAERMMAKVGEHLESIR